MIEHKFYWPDFRCRRKLTVHWRTPDNTPQGRNPIRTDFGRFWLSGHMACSNPNKIRPKWGTSVMVPGQSGDPYKIFTASGHQRTVLGGSPDNLGTKKWQFLSVLTNNLKKGWNGQFQSGIILSDTNSQKFNILETALMGIIRGPSLPTSYDDFYIRLVHGNSIPAAHDWLKLFLLSRLQAPADHRYQIKVTNGEWYPGVILFAY